MYVNRLNYTNRVAVVIPIGGPKSVRNHCESKLYDCVSVLSLCFSEFSVAKRVLS